MSVTSQETAALWDAIARAQAVRAGGQGAPFAAAVLRDGRVIATGVNETHLAGDPSRHAEVVALAAAARHGDLSGATLVSTMQPCEMCLAAMRWAGVARLVFAVRQERVGPGFFQFPGLTLSDFHAAAEEGFEHEGGVLEDEALDLYA